ncbi:hypothetical protein JCM10295v2_001121 [Rhodotorula toruloides]
MSRRIGLELRKNLKRLIPRDEMVELEKAIKIAVVAAAFCSDIDLVLRHEQYHSKAQKEDGKELLPDIVDQLEKHKLIKPHRHLPRPDASYPYTLLGGSGDSLLMKFLRWKAKQMGWTLKEVKDEKETEASTQRDYRVWREKYLEAGVKDVERLHEMNL